MTAAPDVAAAPGMTAAPDVAEAPEITAAPEDKTAMPGEEETVGERDET